MPIFEYRCNDCSNEFEVLQRVSKVDAPMKCPRCGTQETTKRFSAFAAVGTQKKTPGDNAT